MRRLNHKSICRLAVCLGLLGWTVLAGAQRPAPAPSLQAEPVVLYGGTVHTAAGEVIEKGAVAFAEGKLTYVGAAAGFDTTGFEGVVHDLRGERIYPGIIAPNTTLGLTEIDAVRATRDFSETGKFNPSVRSVVAYNTDSRIIPTIRFNGILLAQAVPRSGFISGKSSVMMLDGWNWEDAVYRMDDGMHLHWPRLFRRTGWWASPGSIKPNDKWEEQVRSVKQFFREARAYAEKTHTPDKTHVKYEAMRGLFDGSQTLYVHANYVREIVSAIRFLTGMDIQVVLVGGRDSWRLIDLLKEHDIPVILREAHALPAYPSEDLDQPFKTPAMLQEAGILYCLSMRGAWQQRNLMFTAGTAAAHGLTREQALQSITISSARILGIDERTGTLEAGKDANVVVSRGDILDMRGNHIEYAFIRGRKLDLRGRQQVLYERYWRKYGLE